MQTKFLLIIFIVCSLSSFSQTKNEKMKDIVKKEHHTPEVSTFLMPSLEKKFHQ